MLCTWSRDYGITGTGVDISSAFIASGAARAQELGVADLVDFVHADASGYVGEPTHDIASCLGASWIGGGPEGTITLLERSLPAGGIVLLGEPYWAKEPPDQQTMTGIATARRNG